MQITLAPAAEPAGQWSEPKTLAQWAAIFDVSRNTMGSWLRTGQVRGRRMGHLWCVDVRDIPRETK